MSTPKASSKTADPWEKLGVTTLPISSVHKALDMLWGMEKKITVCLIGDTGVGKTPIIDQWVKAKGGYLKMLNLGHLNSDDISMSMFNKDGTQYDFVPPTWLVEINEYAAKHGLAVLYLDEWNRGDKNVVNSLFTLPDERRIHGFMLHENVLVVAAMNPSDGSYLVNQAERDPAIRKRLNFVFVTPDLAGWLEWGAQNGVDELVRNFVRSQATLFYDVAARDAGKAFPCPANWEKVSNLAKSARGIKGGLTSAVFEALVAGQIGYVAAKKFCEYVRDHNTLIQPDEILRGYMKGGRQRVAALLGCRIVDDRMEKIPGQNIRADVLANLNESLAITLFSEQPDLEPIANNFITYMTDIPIDLYIAFVCENMKKYAGSMQNGTAYAMELSQHCGADSRWMERTRAMHKHHAEIKASIRNTGT
jgi:hypothetical protein